MQWAITVGPRAGGAAALRPGLGRRAARQCGRDPGGLVVVTPLALLAAVRARAIPARARRMAGRSGCCSSSNGARRCRARSGSSTCRRFGAIAARARRRRLAARAARRAVARRRARAAWRRRSRSCRRRRRRAKRGSPRFDVGQGLAVVVRTATPHAALRRRPGLRRRGRQRRRASSCRLLRGAGIERLDLMVLSHEDTDHLGGALTVLESFEVRALASSLPPAHALNALVPRARALRGGRRAGTGTACASSSCIRRPAGTLRRGATTRAACCASQPAGGAMLLTGDIERAAERASGQSNSDLKSDVLLVPHHGSRTSSSARIHRRGGAALGDRRRPAIATASAIRTREVLARYERRACACCAPIWTARSESCLEDDDSLVESERAQRPRYWRAHSGRIE